MVKDVITKFFKNKKGDEDSISKHLIYWILIAACVVIMWFIVNGIIHKLLTLY